MFDFAWSEIALIGIVGLIFIGPKDMPTAIRAVSDLVKKGRKLASEFQTHVDEMVRDADLGEARDTFRDLRNMNIRGQVMKALDSDGSLRRSFSDNPLSPIPAAASQAIPDASHGTSSDPYPALAEIVVPADLPAGEPVDAAADPMPDIVPPQLAQRLRRLRAEPPPPAFLPPGATRPHSRPY